MIMKANKQIGFIYKDNESIDKILKDGEVVFERGFLREKTSTTLPITFGGVGKDLKDYRVYGNTYQNSTTGKNLRYIEDETLAGISLTYDNKSGKISIRGTATKTDGIRLSKGGGVNIPTGTYTLSVSEPLPVLINSIVSLSSSTNVAFRMPAGNTSVTVNVPSDGVLADLYFAVTKDVTYDFDFYLQLEEGSVATEFEPFTNGASPNPGYPQEIVSCGDKTKNLFDKVNSTYKNGYYRDNNGTEQTTQTSGYLTTYISVKPNTTYTIQGSLKQTNQSSQSYAIYYYNINKEWISRTVITDNPPYTFTTPNNCYYMQFQYRVDAYDEDTIQIEEGSTATSYEPYGYKIPVNVNNVITNIYLDEPLRKSSDGMYTDHIDFANKKIYRQIKEITLNGTETWSRVGAKNGAYRFRSDFPDIAIGSNSVLYCTHFLNNGDTYAFEGISGAANIQIYIRWDSLFTTVEDLTTWLASNKPTVDYALATTTEESITLPNIPTIDGNNTLNIETEITPSQVYIKFKSNV